MYRDITYVSLPENVVNLCTANMSHLSKNADDMNILTYFNTRGTESVKYTGSYLRN